MVTSLHQFCARPILHGISEDLRSFQTQLSSYIRKTIPPLLLHVFVWISFFSYYKKHQRILSATTKKQKGGIFLCLVSEHNSLLQIAGNTYKCKAFSSRRESSWRPLGVLFRFCTTATCLPYQRNYTIRVPSICSSQPQGKIDDGEGRYVSPPNGVTYTESIPVKGL